MKRLINKICIFCNHDEYSNDVKNKLIDKLISNKFEIVEENYDLCVAIGGDGAFLRMIKDTKFNSEAAYIGIHTGTLGFAQEVNTDDLDDFIDKLNHNLYRPEKIGIAEITITYEHGISKHFALNDILIRDRDLKTCKLDVEVEDKLLENFVGDGLLISTSFGSTAYNVSFGGAILYNTLNALQITPIAPLNSKVYRNLLNSIVIPQHNEILLQPRLDKNSLLFTIDGDNMIYDNVKTVQIIMQDKYIYCLREPNYHFISKVNEKFLK